MEKKLKRFFCYVFALTFLASVTTANAQSFKVIGYMINWGNGPNLINTFDFTQVTHINYAFQNPDASGNLTSSNAGLATLVTRAHAANVKVLVSLGGAGTSYDTNLRGIWWSLMAPANRAAFIQKIVAYVNANNLDGVDVDIEGDGINGDVDGFIVALCNALQPQGKLVTAALKHDYGNAALFTTSLTRMDFMNIMAYDQTGNWSGTPGQHSTFTYATWMVDYWRGRGVPASKLTLGVPFYGYGWNSNPGVWAFNQVLASFPGNANSDQAGNIIYYNGIQTIKDKTIYACNNGLGGMMIWELTNDVTGSNSLLKAINDSKGSCGGSATVNITSPANNASIAGPSNITINATASTTSGSITKVDFYNGSTLLGSDNSSPYSFTWNNVAPGKYTINAVATSSSGSTATSTITMYVTGPRGGTRWPIPGTVQAEDYDEGPQGSSYNDATTGNAGASYRTDDVDIEPITGGYAVAYTATGEWMKYSVNVTNAGVYNFQVNVAAIATGKSFHIEMDGTNITGAINVPNTGAWGTYQLVTVNNISLTAGSHTMRVFMDTDGFNLDYVKVVALPSPTLTFNNITKTYGDAAFNVSATSNSPGAITYSIISGGAYATITPAGQVTITGAGTVTIQASQAAGGGYNAATTTATLNISKAYLTATADNKSKVFNTANPTLTITYTGFVYGQNASALSPAPSIATTAVTNSPVGSYPITLSGGASANYNIALFNGTLNVTTANPTITFNNLTKTYGDASFNAGATSTSSGALTYSITSGSGFASITPAGQVTILGAGTVTIQVSQAAGGGYNAGSATATLTINKANLTATADNKSKTFNTVNPALTITYTGFEYSDNAASLIPAPTALTTAVTNSPVGSYPITLNGGMSPNYNITLVNGTLTVTAGSPTITFDNITKTYGNPAFAVNATSNSNGAITYSIISGGTFATITPMGMVTITGAGTVTIQASQAAWSGYSSGTATATLTINKANLMASADNKSKVYNTANPALTITYAGFAYSDNAASLTPAPTIATTAVTNSPIGNYPITLTGGASANYNITLMVGVLTVNPANPTLTFNSITKTYGDAAFSASAASNSGGAITYSITSGGAFATITPAGQVSITGAGTVTIQASQAAGGNYTSGTSTTTLTINKASLTITADDKTKVYNTANPALTMSYSGFVYGETSSVLTTSPSISTTAATNSPAGSYPITLTGGSANNYNITLLNGTLTVTSTTATFMFNDITKTYGDAAFTVTATSNSTGAFTYSITSGSAFASITPNGVVTILGAGVVIITANQAAAGSYTAGSTTATLTINKATPSLTYTGATIGDEGTNLNLTATSTSTGAITYAVLSGGTGSGTVSGTQLALGTSGTITLQISVAGDDNYLPGSITQQITINTVTGVMNSNLSNATLTIFPNPAYEYANIELAMPESIKGSLVLCDMNGKTLYVIVEGTIENQSTYSIPMSEYPNGVYVVKLVTEKGSMTKKIVK